MVTGLAEEATHDEVYNQVFNLFDAQYKGLQTFDKQLLSWTKSIKGI